MLKLIKCEVIKFFSLKFILSVIFILALFSFLIIFLNRNNEFKKITNSEFSEVLKRGKYEKTFDNDYKSYKFQYDKLSKEIKKNNLYNESVSNVNHIEYALQLIPFISLFVIIFSSYMLLKEFKEGSIKMYLAKPVKRWKVLLAKQLALFIFLLFFMLVFLIFLILCVFIIHDINVLSANHLIFINEVESVNYFIYFLKIYMANIIPLMFNSVLGIFFAVLLNSFLPSFSFCVFFNIFSALVSNILFGLKLNFIEFIFLPYMDFSIFNNMINIYEMNIVYGINLNAVKGLIILTIFSFFIMTVSIIIFSKKDIKN